jgi:hypothetical protein
VTEKDKLIEAALKAACLFALFAIVYAVASLLYILFGGNVLYIGLGILAYLFTTVVFYTLG